MLTIVKTIETTITAWVPHMRFEGKQVDGQLWVGNVEYAMDDASILGTGLLISQKIEFIEPFTMFNVNSVIQQDDIPFGLLDAIEGDYTKDNGFQLILEAIVNGVGLNSIDILEELSKSRIQGTYLGAIVNFFNTRDGRFDPWQLKTLAGMANTCTAMMKDGQYNFYLDN